MPIRFTNGANRHLSDLGTPSHDDDPLAIDLQKWFCLFNGMHDRQRFQLLQQQGRVGYILQFEIYSGTPIPSFQYIHIADISLVLCQDSRQLGESSNLVFHPH
jgi:hypothetical protein